MRAGAGRGRPTTIDHAREETAFERTVRTYPVAILFGGCALLVTAYAWALGYRTVLAAGLVALVAALLLSAMLDPVLVIWLRWRSVLGDADLVANATGIPDVHAVWPTTDGVKVRFSGLAVAPSDVFAAEEAIAAGFGYSAAVIEERRGLVRTTRRRYVMTLTRKDGLVEAFDLGDEMRNRFTINGSRIVMGRDKSMGWVEWDPLGTPGHVAVAGATRSGKSVLTYGMLAQLAPMRDVVVVGVDPTGILAKPWGADWWASGTADMTRAADLLEREVAEMDSRNGELANLGVDKIGSVSPEVPLRVIVFEEFAGIVKAAEMQDRKVRQRIELALARLVAEGAKAAIRVILLTQRASAKVVDTDARSNFAVRITLRVEDGESVRMLHPDLDQSWVDAVKKYTNGVGIVDIPGFPTRKFRAVYIGPREYEKYLVAVGVGRDLAFARGGVLDRYKSEQGGVGA